MKKQPQKRLPHGVTQALVLDALMRLSVGKTAVRAVTRAEIRQALPQLSEATIDDRLRVLKKNGRIENMPGGYKPFIPEAPPPKWRIPARPKGTTAVAYDLDGGTVHVEWL